MQRLLHEGMDAGLCGFSIQRLGRNSTQADFDGTPMVTDTMCDEDILALAEVLRRARRGLHPDHPGDRRHQGRPGVRREAGRGGRPPDPAQRHRRRPARNPDVAPQVAALARASAGTKGLPVFGQCATVRAGFVFTLEHWNLYDVSPGVARADHRHPRGEAGQDGRPGAARGAWSRPRKPTRRATASCVQAGVGGPLDEPRRAGRRGQRRAADSTSAARSADIGRGRGQAPGRGHARPVAGRPISTPSSSARTRAPTPTSWPR